MANPLVSDQEIDFLLYEVFDVGSLTTLPGFTQHSAETFAMYLDTVRRFARQRLFPAYGPMDTAPPQLRDGRVTVHPLAKELFAELLELGVMTAERSETVGGFELPWLVTTAANIYLMAANLAAYGYVALTSGAAHLIEVFGDDQLRQQFMAPMYAGRWTGTMALTEPDAGSSLADLRTTATPTLAGHYLMRGSKIFISGGDQDITENVVHLTLARMDGAPAGSKGVSLFVVPAKRPVHVDAQPDAQPNTQRRASQTLVYNDVYASQLIHKIGTRGLASVGLTYGDNNDCHGWLIGAPGRGLACMFQMMNEARILVGAEGAATASVAYQEALAYAKERPQGRPLGSRDPSSRDPTSPQQPIIAHADVRRMLLRQKAIVEGAIAVVLKTAQVADRASHAVDSAPPDNANKTRENPEKSRLSLLLGLLTPVCKTFPAERGFEANTLAIQVHGGYGYTSEYPVESWWRDQKLNSIHEGTTGIQGLDLLGRKVMAGQGAALRVLAAEISASIALAVDAGVQTKFGEQLGAAMATLATVTALLGQKGATGDLDAMLLHSADYLEAFSTIVVAWQWLDMATAAQKALKTKPKAAFYLGKLQTAQYYFATELPKVHNLLELCSSSEPSYGEMQPDWF